jgi:hypothetical protein
MCTHHASSIDLSPVVIVRDEISMTHLCLLPIEFDTHTNTNTATSHTRCRPCDNEQSLFDRVKTMLDWSTFERVTDKNVTRSRRNTRHVAVRRTNRIFDGYRSSMFVFSVPLLVVIVPIPLKSDRRVRHAIDILSVRIVTFGKHYRHPICSLSIGKVNSFESVVLSFPFQIDAVRTMNNNTEDNCRQKRVSHPVNINVARSNRMTST